MTKDELFPRSEFPLRAKAVVEWPERKLRTTLEAHYQKPPSYATEEPAEQTVGGLQTVTSYDGLLVLTVVTLERRGGEIIFFTARNENMITVSETEIENIFSDFAAKFRATYGEIDDEEATRVMNEKIDAAQWEMF